MRWWAFPAATSTSSRASPAPTSLTSVTGWERLSPAYEIIGTKDTPGARSSSTWPLRSFRGRVQRCTAWWIPRREWPVSFAERQKKPGHRRRTFRRRYTFAGWNKPYQTVLSVMPAHVQRDLDVGAKGMYKMEPVVADGGEVIIYAPHIHEFSVVHGKYIKRDRLSCTRLFCKTTR